MFHNGPGIPLSKVKTACDNWTIALHEHLGLFRPRNIFGWDSLPPEKRREMLAIWDEGIDNITRWKLGGPPQ